MALLPILLIAQNGVSLPPNDDLLMKELDDALPEKSPTLQRPPPEFVKLLMTAQANYNNQRMAKNFFRNAIKYIETEPLAPFLWPAIPGQPEILFLSSLFMVMPGKLDASKIF